jgi:hypothetical protein
MAGAGVLPLVTAPTIANVRLDHVLIDGCAGLSVISYAAFKHLQIPESKLAPSRPFCRVGPDPVYPVGTITLPVTFGTEDNFRTENVQFEVAEVNLPFNAIIGRLALYRFMAIAHYGYLVLKMPCPAGVLTIQSDRATAVVAVEKLHALATGLAPATGAQGSDPSTSRAKALAKAPKVRPSDTDDVPVKTVQVRAETSQTTRIDVFDWEPSQMPGIPRDVIEHHLKIHPDARPVRQKPRKQSIERQNFIREQVRKLLQAGFIEEVYHPVWLAVTSRILRMLKTILKN